MNERNVLATPRTTVTRRWARYGFLVGFFVTWLYFAADVLYGLYTDERSERHAFGFVTLFFWGPVLGVIYGGIGAGIGALIAAFSEAVGRRENDRDDKPNEGEEALRSRAASPEKLG